jgi:hypothetical protein
MLEVVRSEDLKMERIHSKTLVTTSKTTQCHIPEHHNPQIILNTYEVNSLS